jgi:biotin carboxyl carrier protein
VSDGPDDPPVDPRAVRVGLAPASAHAGLAPIVVEPGVPAAEHEGLTQARILLLPAEGAASAADRRSGVTRREVVVDGWRVEVEVEPERRAALRERARRGRAEAARGGPTEVHAIIPGVVVAVSVDVGDAVVTGQQLLVVEAMKMQNELRAPRDGTVGRIAVGAGRTVDVGDLLLVIE